jgi:PTH1 family peptidyl-tRNA hydrolase
VAFGSRGERPERRGTSWDALVVGLGNPGAAYRNTLHNVGAQVVELLAERHHERLKKAKESALVAEIRLDAKRVALAIPQTFMNDSGRAVAPLARRYGVAVEPANIVIVHDELDLEPGRLKVKIGGGLAGHNGLRSVKAHLHSDEFVRIRIGVGKPPGGAERGADHVLSAPSRRDRELIAVCVVEAADAVEMVVVDGIDAAMGHYNRR